jgi:prenyltransferase beta subunit
MLLNIFYFIGLFIIIINLIKLKKYSDFVDVNEWVLKFNKVTKSNAKKTDFKSEDDYHLLLGVSALSIFEFIWILFGIISDNWVIFTIILLINFTLNQIFQIGITKVQKVLGTIFIVFKLIITIIMVLNHFHFNIDIQKILFNI